MDKTDKLIKNLKEEYIIFKQVYYDSQQVLDKSETSFFAESEENMESVTSMTEEQAVKWLLKKDAFRHSFISEFFADAKNIKDYFSLQEPFTTNNEKPGDIDLLLVDPDKPDQSIAFECKRIKAVSLRSSTSKINNVERVW